MAALSLALAACAGYAEEEDLSNPDAAFVCHDAHGYSIACGDVEPTIPDQQSSTLRPAGEESAADVTIVETPEDGQLVAGELGPDVVASTDDVGSAPAGEGEGCPIPKLGYASQTRMGEMLVPVSPGEARRTQRRARRLASRERRRAARRSRVR